MNRCCNRSGMKEKTSGRCMTSAGPNKARWIINNINDVLGLVSAICKLQSVEFLSLVGAMQANSQLEVQNSEVFWLLQVIPVWRKLDGGLWCAGRLPVL